MNEMRNVLTGSEVEIGDTITLPSITEAVFIIVNDPKRGKCLHTKSGTFEAFVSLTDAEYYGMVKVNG